VHAADGLSYQLSLVETSGGNIELIVVGATLHRRDAEMEPAIQRYGGPCAMLR